MTFNHLIDRLTSAYGKGRSSILLAKLKFVTDSTISFQKGEVLNISAPFLVINDSDLGPVDIELDITFKDGNDVSQVISVTILANSWIGEATFVKLSTVTNANTCLEITNIVATSPATKNDSFSFWSLSGNVSKLMGDIAAEIGEWIYDLKNDAADQRFLELSRSYGLDQHGADVGVLRLGETDDDFRGRVRLAKTFGPGTEPNISEALIIFAGLITPPSFIPWYEGQWILNQSSLPNGLILGGIKGIGRLMAECKIVQSETSKTQDELQAFVDDLTAVATYIRIKFI
jgi:hypothetical protein